MLLEKKVRVECWPKFDRKISSEYTAAAAAAATATAAVVLMPRQTDVTF